MVAHTFNLSIWKVEARRTHILGYFGLCSRTAPCTPPRDKQNSCVWWRTFRFREQLFSLCLWLCDCDALLGLPQLCLCLAVWEGGSVWDLPLDTAAPGPALEQLQQLEKAKAAKVWNLLFTAVCLPSSYRMQAFIDFISFFSSSCLFFLFSLPLLSWDKYICIFFVSFSKKT